MPEEKQTAAETPNEEQILTSNLGHLVQVLDLAHTVMVAKVAQHVEPEPYHIIIIAPDAAPVHRVLRTPDDVCEALVELRQQVIVLANAPPDEDASTSPTQIMFWAYVFQGRHLQLSTGRLWQLRDGDRVYDITAPPTTDSSDGCISVPLNIEDEPDEMPEDAQ